MLRTRPFGESDLIAVLFTEDMGKVSGIAKGARRSKRRFSGGALEPFQETRTRLSLRPHAGLAFLHESTVVTPNHAVATDLDAFAWASYVTELTELMTAEADPCPEVFALYRNVIAEIGSQAPESFAHHYILGLLDHGGWGPDFHTCGVCAEPVVEYSRPILDNRGSGVICSRHEAEQQGIDPDHPAFKPSRRIIDADLMDYVREACLRAPAGSTPEVRRLATALLNRLVDLHLTRPPKSRAFLTSLGEGAATTKEPAT